MLGLFETQPGRHVYAVGNAPEATRLTGIATDKVLLDVYVAAGFFRAWRRCCRWRAPAWATANAGQTANRDAIIAVVLGGTSSFGGSRIILGSLLAAVIVGVFRNGLTLIGLPSVYLVLITGILVILAVTTDQLLRKGARVMSAALTNTAPLVMQAKAVVKRYRQVTALDSCDFEPHAGEIMSVIGDNGAGKSSPMDARREGLETVNQGLAVASAMAIAENLFAGRELIKPSFFVAPVSRN